MIRFVAALSCAFFFGVGASAASYKISLKADITLYEVHSVYIYGLQKPRRLPEFFKDGACDSSQPTLGDDCYVFNWDVADIIKSFRFDFAGPPDLMPSGRVTTRGQLILHEDPSMPGGYRIEECSGILYLGCVRNDPPESGTNVIFDPARPQGLFVEAGDYSTFALSIENGRIYETRDEFGSARTPFGYLTYGAYVNSGYDITGIKVRDLSQVPLPAGVWFLVSGLAAFGLARRRSAHA